MVDICKILFEITENKEVLNPDCELIDSGILDSFTFIELFTKLEELGVNVSPARIKRDMLKTPKSIQECIDSLSIK